MNTPPQDPTPTREALARALVAELGCTPEAAAHLAGMHEDVVELGDDELEITIED